MAIIWVTHELAGCTVVIVAANHCGNSGLSFISHSKRKTNYFTPVAI